jgi:hypothetical protein
VAGSETIKIENTGSLEFMTKNFYLLGVIFIAGCGTVFQGTSQQIVFSIEPEGAICELTLEGNVIGSVSPKSNIITVPKNNDDIIAQCNAPGYQKKTIRIESSASKGGISSVFLFDLGITDLSTGAYWEYPKTVSVVLRKVS